MTDSPYAPGLLKIGRQYEANFKKDSAAFKKLVNETTSVASVGATIYSIMVGAKMCTPIEKLEPNVKQELWDEAKAWCPGADKEKLINTCKLIWAIENL